MLAVEENGTRTRPVERALWPATGFVTIKQILGKNGGPIPISESRWYIGVKRGEFPKPLKIAGKAVWRVSDINALVDELERKAVQERRLARLAHTK